MGADGGACLLVEAAFGSDEEGCGPCMGGKCLGHGRATLFIREEEVAAWGAILQKVLKLHHLAQFWQSGAHALFGGFHQMDMQAGKIQLVHSSAGRGYGPDGSAHGRNPVNKADL